ncbi:MAG TPA: hypothetical protein VLJ57_01420 [Burkholderiaceae bacterium]|nr:hypothetical protein [Burkholderiaceae bacterium]
MISIAPIAPTVRQCGECNLCCQGWLAAKVLEHDMKPGSPCPHCRVDGCGIYDHRPSDPCRTFACGWLAPASPFPEDFRPDKLGVIVLKIDWRGRRAWVLVPAGQYPDERLLEHMRQYSTSTGEPHLIVKKPGNLLCFGSVEFQQDMVAMEQRGENPW